jgi:hypothetical protein
MVGSRTVFFALVVGAILSGCQASNVTTRNSDSPGGDQRAAGESEDNGCILADSPSGKTIYYVATDGEDTNPGTEAAPLRTIQAAADVVEPGDTVVVRDGVYGAENKEFPVNIARSGTSAAWITFRAEHQWKAILDGNMECHSFINFEAPVSYVTVEGFEIRKCNNSGFWAQTNSADPTNGTHHIAIRHNYVHNIGNYETTSAYGITGIYVGSQNHDFVIDANLWHDIGRTGPDDYWMNKDHALYLAGWDPGPCYNIEATNNIIYNNSGDGISADCDDCVISNNLVAWSNTNSLGGTDFLSLSMTRKNVLIQNNIFYQPPSNGSGQCAMWAAAEMINVTVRNNMVFGGTMWYPEQNPTFTTANNYCLDQCENDEVDPLLVGVSNDRDPTNDDWQLQSDSPAIDAGEADQAPTHDFNGRARPSGLLPDIGPFEYGSTSCN